MRVFFTYLFLIVFFFPLHAQQEVIVEKMNMSYEIRTDRIFISLSAPTEGWLAVGFNRENSIVGSDLKMVRVSNGKVEGEDRFVEAPGYYPSDLQLGGKENILIEKGTESRGMTQVSFSIPIRNEDKNDFQHDLGKDFWLILAYSVEDDFEHHSIMRKHLKFRFK